jgi:hypothetical protein
MAKGQMRSNKEKKKPKADHNKKKKGGPALSPFALAREQPQPGQNPFGKKSQPNDGGAFTSPLRAGCLARAPREAEGGPKASATPQR